jgi:hypothetical protein
MIKYIRPHTYREPNIFIITPPDVEYLSSPDVTPCTLGIRNFLAPLHCARKNNIRNLYYSKVVSHSFNCVTFIAYQQLIQLALCVVLTKRGVA